jgi:lysozyme
VVKGRKASAKKPAKKKTAKASARKRTARKPARRKTVAPRPRPAVNPDDGDPYILCEDTCGHIHGIDLSHYQGEVFWETVGSHTKMAYVYLKATEGGDRIDARYERNIELAHRYGLKVGSYHFFRPKTPLHLQLRNFTAQCLPGEQDLIPMIDVETTGSMPDAQFCDSLKTFLRMIERAYRQKPLVYTFRNFYNWHLVGQLDGYQLMVAMYQDEEPVLADGRDITMWQYTGKGRIVGVNGYVDKSRFMGDHTLREIRFRH